MEKHIGKGKRIVSRRKSVTNYALENETRVCPVCGEEPLAAFEICGCGWQNDPVQYDDPDYSGGANRMSLNEARKAYAEGREIE